MPTTGKSRNIQSQENLNNRNSNVKTPELVSYQIIDVAVAVEGVVVSKLKCH